MYQRQLGLLIATLVLANALPLALPLASADHPVGGSLQWLPSNRATSVDFTYEEARQGTGVSKVRLELGDGRKACLDNLAAAPSGKVTRTGYIVSDKVACTPGVQLASFTYTVTTKHVTKPGVAVVDFGIDYGQTGAFKAHWWATNAAVSALASGDLHVVTT